MGELLPSPPGFGPPGAGAPPRGGGGFGPGRFIGPGLFAAMDVDKDGSLNRGELKTTFSKWFVEWDVDKRGVLQEEQVRVGLGKVLPAPDFGGRGGGPSGPGGGRGVRGGRGGPGFGGGPGGGGVRLDPLVSLNDTSKPLASKLLAVPALRARYLGYVREIAEKWLDWSRLGPIAQGYHSLIAEDVKADTRKLGSTEAFLKSLDGGAEEGASREKISFRRFAEQRRAFLLNHPEVKAASLPQ
jgi:hypothetical protein